MRLVKSGDATPEREVAPLLVVGDKVWIPWYHKGTSNTAAYLARVVGIECGNGVGVLVVVYDGDKKKYRHAVSGVENPVLFVPDGAAAAAAAASAGPAAAAAAAGSPSASAAAGSAAAGPAAAAAAAGPAAGPAAAGPAAGPAAAAAASGPVKAKAAAVAAVVAVVVVVAAAAAVAFLATPAALFVFVVIFSDMWATLWFTCCSFCLRLKSSA